MSQIDTSKNFNKMTANKNRFIKTKDGSLICVPFISDECSTRKVSPLRTANASPDVQPDKIRVLLAGYDKCQYQNTKSP